ncbi:Mini-ribonuclease 3 [Thermobrachium celere]|uniref:Mini-ribonuclease 3 n=1 Tax=Thermobrachium celere DSM 8682 TaxID=941824 RepID=R7RS74_9CLOT|nr:ribonuclease III domain-containing protein [Thermobrachium celere]CDF58914.1 COG1939: Ribonuclease III family protein [Thermobrachium celere DSM 8682]
MLYLDKYVGLSEKEVKLLNPIIWAYIGDAVYEMFVRSYLITMGIVKPNQIHKSSILYVKASNQARFLKEVEPMLTEEEKEIVRRTRNAKVGHVPKNANLFDYKMATAFEGLIGYLFLMKRYDRLDEIIEFTLFKIEK